MKHKIGILSVGLSLLPQVQKFFPKEYAAEEFLVKVLEPVPENSTANQENAIRVMREMERCGVDILITRGGILSTVRDCVPIPVLHLDVVAIDIFRAIGKAAPLGRNIVLLTWEKTMFRIEDWSHLLNASVEQVCFATADEARNVVARYAERKDSCVIVAGGIGADCARKLGIESVVIGCSDETLSEAVLRAQEILRKEERERYENEKLRSILSSVHDAVVAIDTAGKIILFNPSAERLLRCHAGDLLERDVRAVLPELAFLTDTHAQKRPRLEMIRPLGELTVAVNTTPIVSNGVERGTLCSFQDITRLQKLEQKIRYTLHKKGLYAKYHFTDIITHSANLQQTIARAELAAKSNCSVMIYGESGTGKELMAQSIHNASSRKDAPFVAVNCAALSENLLESELFGYDEGAFTGARKGGKAGLFELAHGGSIFLDEINSVSVNLQTKLLRVIEEREIMHLGSDHVIPLDVRIITASNERLKEKIEGGAFRRDLFFRLCTLELIIPPLRDRPDDILPLFYNYLSKETPAAAHLAPEQENQLVRYTWPGNVRELRNVVQRYALFGAMDLDESEIAPAIVPHTGGLIDLKEIDRYVEEKIIQRLQSRGLTRTQMADILGISRTTMWKKITPPESQ